MKIKKNGFVMYGACKEIRARLKAQRSILIITKNLTLHDLCKQ
jgi:hypothetical protein